MGAYQLYGLPSGGPSFPNNQSIEGDFLSPTIIKGNDYSCMGPTILWAIILPPLPSSLLCYLLPITDNPNLRFGNIITPGNQLECRLSPPPLPWAKPAPSEIVPGNFLGQLFSYYSKGFGPELDAVAYR